MRRLGIATVVMALSMVGALSVAQAAGTFGLRVPVSVTPARGTPTATFTIGFTSPLGTGLSQSLRSWEVATVTDRGQGGPSCTSAKTVRLPTAVGDHHVSVTLAAAPTKRWCTGAYGGTITLYRAIVCGPRPVMRPTACPEIAF